MTGRQNKPVEAGTAQGQALATVEPKPVKKKVGRKSKCTPELVTELLDIIKRGASNEDACAVVGLDVSTFYDWINQKPEFSNAVKKAYADRKVGLINKILFAAETTWQAAAWYLERVYKGEFAAKAELEHSGQVQTLGFAEAVKLINEAKKKTEKADESKPAEKPTPGA